MDLTAGLLLMVGIFFVGIGGYIMLAVGLAIWAVAGVIIIRSLRNNP